MSVINGQIDADSAVQQMLAIASSYDCCVEISLVTQNVRMNPQSYRALELIKKKLGCQTQENIPFKTQENSPPVVQNLEPLPDSAIQIQDH